MIRIGIYNIKLENSNESIIMDLTMKKNYFAMTCTGIVTSLCISFFMMKNKHTEVNHLDDKAEVKSFETDIKNKAIESSPEHGNSKQDVTLQKKVKDMTPSEYIAWVKNPRDRVLLEIKQEGTKIYRKGNVTITVMPDGKELYMPDEL